MEENYENYRRENESNVLGIFGFVLSLLCITAIIGLPLSLIALRKRPRGFAIAGTIIGLIFVGIWVASAVALSSAAKASGLNGVGPAFTYYMETMTVSGTATKQLEEQGSYALTVDELSKLPSDAATDEWGHKYRIRWVSDVNGQVLADVYSVGPDGVDGTDDDIASFFSFLEKRGALQPVDPETLNENSGVGGQAEPAEENNDGN